MIDMTTFEMIQELSKKRGKNIKEVALEIGFSENAFYKWKTSSPSAENLQRVADYFNVSTDYLLGRTEKKNYYDLTEKDEKDIAKQLESMIEDLSETMLYSKDTTEIDKETKELLLASLENSLRIAKIEAKKRFTPKKYRD